MPCMLRTLQSIKEKVGGVALTAVSALPGTTGGALGGGGWSGCPARPHPAQSMCACMCIGNSYVRCQARPHPAQSRCAHMHDEQFMQDIRQGPAQYKARACA
eukprot:1147235-Pelagomonas_calceolata.AAC.2